MKKLLAFLFLCNLSIAGASADAIKTTINCTIHGQKREANPNWGNAGAVLYQIKDGAAVKIAMQRPDDNWNITFKVDVKEGVFFITRGGGKGGSLKYVIYLKAGENKKVDLFYTTPVSLDFDSCVVDQPNTETKSLQAWLKTMNRYQEEARQIPLGSNSLIQKHEAFQKKAALFLAANKTANPYFNAWLADKVYADLQYVRAASFYRWGRLNATPDSSAAVQSFYKPLSDKKIINDVRLLRSEHGMELLNYIFGYLKVKEGNKEKIMGSNFTPENASRISNSSIKVVFLLYTMPGIKEYEVFVKHVQPNKNLFVTEEQKAAYNKFYNDLGPFAIGKPGYNFELKDVNDKTHTLAGFKGKVVVIDVWAMWCAPCLAEKPVMEKIAEEYHDRNDIVFLGISVDGHSKKELWKDFVKRKGFTTIELLTQFDESLFKYYKISGIPRFLIFDREGKVVTTDAPYPSNPAFKKIVDEALASTK